MVAYQKLNLVLLSNNQRLGNTTTHLSPHYPGSTPQTFVLTRLTLRPTRSSTISGDAHLLWTELYGYEFDSTLRRG